MELFEKVNRAFGSWYEGLFGGSDDVRPKDILRKIFAAMEENRKEHLDDKIYVPNHYILEISVEDEEEKEYLRSFLDREELENAILRYCKQNQYHIRGGLEFTIKEEEPSPDSPRREKVRIRCRYDSKLAAVKPAARELLDLAPEAPALPAPVQESAMAGLGMARTEEEGATVYAIDYDAEEEGTVPAVAMARLTIYPPGKPSFEYSIARSTVSIGRSAHANNDLVLADEKASRRHARLELDVDGHFTLYDLDTTNGTRVNGQRVDNTQMRSGDEILIGATRLVFTQEGEEGRAKREEGRETPQHSTLSTQHSSPRLVLMDGERDVEAYVLASETVIGRGVTNDIVLNERSVATRHVQLKRGTPFTLDVLDAEHMTLLNGSQLRPGEQRALQSGDRISLGALTLRFEQPEKSPLGGPV